MCTFEDKGNNHFTKSTPFYSHWCKRDNTILIRHNWKKLPASVNSKIEKIQEKKIKRPQEREKLQCYIV